MRQLVIGRAPPLISRTLIVPPNYKLERTVAQVVTSLSQVFEVVDIVLKSMRLFNSESLKSMRLFNSESGYAVEPVRFGSDADVWP